MVILFSAKLALEQEEKLETNFPNETFVFCKNMDEAVHHLSKVEILVTYGADLNAELIERAKNLKWIMALTAGIEKMPLEMIRQKEILVTNVRGIHKIPMSEYAISMLLQVYRQEKVFMKNQTNRKWDQSIPIKEISGKTMLIAGTGKIGQELARLAKAFQMKTYGVSRSGRTVDYFDDSYPMSELDKILPQADFVVSILPSTAETKGVFTNEQFQKMASHAVFLNMGRGDAVNSADLLKAVQSGEIAHAVLDVFDEEPLPNNHPFWQEDNITITPHLSGLSPYYQICALEIFERNLHSYIEGKDNYVNKIDVTRGY